MLSAGLSIALRDPVTNLAGCASILCRDDPSVPRIAASGLFLVLGSLCHTLSLPDLSDPGHIAAYRDHGEVTLRGRVVREPDVRDTHVLRSGRQSRGSGEGSAPARRPAEMQVRGPALLTGPPV
jgi:hypothetical protein